MISEPSNPAGQEETTSPAPATTAVNMEHNTAEFRFNEAPGFGSRLRAAREAKGLDLETCGHALRLPMRVLKQLENSEFTGNDYQVYIGGYIRKYGRYLDIDDSEIEEAVARLKPEQPPLVATGGISHSRYLLDRYATAATYVVLTLVIAVPTVWLGMRGTLTHDMSHLAPLDAAPVAQQDAPAAGCSGCFVKRCSEGCKQCDAGAANNVCRTRHCASTDVVCRCAFLRAAVAGFDGAGAEPRQRCERYAARYQHQSCDRRQWQP
jgi:cytoskeleton protein RodZ